MSTRTMSRGTVITFAALSGAGLLGSLAACSSPNTETAPTQTPSGQDAPSTVPAPTGSGSAAGGSGSTYKDGSYRADGSYTSPNGTETVTVDVTLKNDVVTAVTVTPHPDNPNTRQFQTAFAGAISGAVVGKDIDQISVSRLAGSSLTSGGFAKALSQIKADATP